MSERITVGNRKYCRLLKAKPGTILSKESFMVPPLEYWGGGLFFLFIFEINIFVGKIGEINKWPQGMVEIQPIPR